MGFRTFSSMLVGLSGLEPPTSRLSGVRSNRLSYKPIWSSAVQFSLTALGGDKRDRTVDLLLAKQALSQLSYTPIFWRLHSGVLPSFFPLFTFKVPYLESFDPSRALKIKQRSTQNFRNLTLDVKPASFICSCLHRKEVIQPHLPIRLPCYDFTPVANPTFGSALLAVRLLTSGITGSHGVTGGVYKARERIHRGMLIRDY